MSKWLTANQTESPEKLMIKGPKHATSPEIVANSPSTFAAELPSGNYTIAGSGGGEATFKVGPYRASSKNDLLLP